jgi:hypothetical protein
VAIDIGRRIATVHSFLETTSRILITYGTAWSYSRKDTGEAVANCHKLPQGNFQKRLLNSDEVVESFGLLFNRLRNLNPDISIILTLSPVRHLRDTLELNSVSKAVLRVACHHIAEQFESVEYFPAYEMMMDDLRDYRFYKSDMLHPTEDAEDYIWDKFSEKYFTSETKTFLKEWGSVLAALAHRPFHPASEAHQRFLKETLKKLEGLKSSVDVREEIAAVRGRIVWEKQGGEGKAES